ncbi:MAG: carboxypeptidase-like regulatory domain-containing protein [Prevotellaceae bacterium]|jgi:hypothetical protein|nr:carboxypeptidase-like regulatory domain-containing protein [Prevotellaceae bacterium]
MKKLELKTRKWLRGILMGSSLTAVAFIFQACYGMIRDFGFDVTLSGSVRSKSANLPIQGIKVSVPNTPTYAITDENGNFSFHAYVDAYQQETDSTGITVKKDHIPVLFSDIDSTENGGWFADKEVIISHINQDAVKIDVELEEK